MANLVAAKRKSSVVDVEDIKRAYSLFLDSERSVQYLSENVNYYVNEAGAATLSEGDKVIKGTEDKMDLS